MCEEPNNRARSRSTVQGEPPSYTSGVTNLFEAVGYFMSMESHEGHTTCLLQTS